MLETNRITNLMILASMIFFLIFLSYAYLQHSNLILFILSLFVVITYFVARAVDRGVLIASERSKKLASSVQTLDLLAAIIVVVLNYQLIS